MSCRSTSVIPGRSRLRKKFFFFGSASPWYLGLASQSPRYYPSTTGTPLFSRRLASSSTPRRPSPPLCCARALASKPPGRRAKTLALGSPLACAEQLSPSRIAHGVLGGRRQPMGAARPRHRRRPAGGAAAEAARAPRPRRLHCPPRAPTAAAAPATSGAPPAHRSLLRNC